MNVFEKNIRVLEKKYPELIRVLDYWKEEDSAYELVLTRSNESNLQITKDGKAYTLHSKYSPVSEAEKWVAGLSDDRKNDDQVLIFGLGMGYFPEALLLSPQFIQRFILFEPDIKVFNWMIRSRDITSILEDERVKMIAVGDHEFVMAELAHYISTRMSGNLAVFAPPIYQRMYGNELVQLKDLIQGAVINEASNQQTHEKFNKQWIQNILFNLPYTIKYPSLHFLKDHWKGMKAIIIGSGPSLEKDAHYLNRLKGKCFIIAAGSSVQALQHFGVNPDLVIAMDGGIANYRVFEKLIQVGRLYYSLLRFIIKYWIFIRIRWFLQGLKMIR
ncbi:hypothetical protein HMSSN036_23580 [Paenibacillus macerans]|nr:hypothetical protein HMSSN036_23580 [Paenibacillus macerans]